MLQGGEYRRVLKHAIDGHTLVMMASYAAQVGEMWMLLFKRIRKKVPNKKQ